MVLSLKVGALLPAVLAAIAFALTLLTTLAGREPGQLEDFHFMQLNTSHVGQNLVVFSTASPDPGAPLVQAKLSLPNPLSDSALGDLGGLFPAVPDLNSSLSAISDSIGGSIGAIVSNITDAIDGGLTTIENTVVKELMDLIGVRDYYGFYSGNICTGMYSNSTDPNAAASVDDCPTWSNVASMVNGTIPSSVRFATVNASVPALEMVNNMKTPALGLFVGLMKFIFASGIISLIGNSFVFLFSLAAVFQRVGLIVKINIGFAALAATFQSLVAFTVIIFSIAGTLANTLGGAVTLSATAGTKAIVVSVLSAVFTTSALVFWTVIWFVDHRSISFRARRREKDEIGNWKGMPSEMLSDLKGLRRPRLFKQGQ